MADSFYHGAHKVAKRPTISDLARAAGVGVATVDRVLNGRLPVREETARRVYEAANSIGYHAAGLIRQRMRQELPEYRLGFLLQKPGHHFYQEFAHEIGNAVGQAVNFRGAAAIEYCASQAPDEIVAKLKSLAGRCRAIGVVAPDHPSITAAVHEMKARNIPVFSMLTDCAAGIREGYVGVNNRKAGRTAAWMIANAAKKPGKVALFVGSHRFHGHELREIGFRAFFREEAPEFTALDTMVNLETRQITSEAMSEILRRYPDLAGCYVAGGGMEGAIAAIREAQMEQPPVMIVNEITPESRAALADKIVTMVMATPLPRLCRELVELMGHAIERGAANAPGQTFLPFDIYLPENI